jgi:hypothetical protein
LKLQVSLFKFLPFSLAINNNPNPKTPKPQNPAN